MKRRTWLALLAAPLAWLGCNGLLGIDDATFVPLDDAGTVTDGGPSADGSSPIVNPGVVAVSRAALRVPVGDTGRIEVSVSPLADAGPVGRVTLSATSADPKVVAAVTQAGEHAFVLDLTANAAEVNADVVVSAFGDGGVLLGTNVVRVRVRAPGTFEGLVDDGGLPLEDIFPAGDRYPGVGLLAAGPFVYVGDEYGLILAVDENGATRTIGGPPESDACKAQVLALGDASVAFGGTCVDEDTFEEAAYRAELPLGVTNAVSVFPSRIAGEVFAGIAYQGRSFVLTKRESDGNAQLRGGPLTVEVGTATELVPTDLQSVTGGLLVVARTADESGIVLRQRKVAPDGTTSPDGEITLPAADALFDGPRAVQTARGEVAVAWTTSGTKGEVALLSGPTGPPLGRFVTDLRIATQIAADRRGRIVVVSESSSIGESTVQRLSAGDAGLDPTFPQTVITCAGANVAVDRDGLIVVVCSDFDAFAYLYRIWP